MRGHRGGDRRIWISPTDTEMWLIVEVLKNGDISYLPDRTIAKVNAIAKKLDRLLTKGEAFHE